MKLIVLMMMMSFAGFTQSSKIGALKEHREGILLDYYDSSRFKACVSKDLSKSDKAKKLRAYQESPYRKDIHFLMVAMNTDSEKSDGFFQVMLGVKNKTCIGDLKLAIKEKNEGYIEKSMALENKTEELKYCKDVYANYGKIGESVHNQSRSEGKAHTLELRSNEVIKKVSKEM